MNARLAPLALALAACAPSPPASSSAAIIGGVRDTGDPAVVLLISYPGDQSTYYTCTASVIAPTVLLTAAHCVDDAHHAGYSFGAFLGDDASTYANAAAFAAVLAPATGVHAHPAYDPNAPFTADIGVVILANPLSVTPLPIARAPLPSTLPGTAARLVGYGQTIYGTYNATKYATATSVLSLPGDDTVVVGDVAKHSCVGDSGGPALVQLGGTETVIGVDSYTDTTGCTEPSHYRRVDDYLPFIDAYAPVPLTNDLGTGGGNDLSTSPSDLATEADAAFHPIDAVHDSGGCSVIGPSSASSLGAALLLALLAAATSRRRRS